MESKKKSDPLGYQPSLKARELESGMSNRHSDLRKPAVQDAYPREGSTEYRNMRQPRAYEHETFDPQRNRKDYYYNRADQRRDLQRF